jgi:hypothetical protein
VAVHMGWGLFPWTSFWSMALMLVILTLYGPNGRGLIEWKGKAMKHGPILCAAVCRATALLAMTDIAYAGDYWSETKGDFILTHGSDGYFSQEKVDQSGAIDGYDNAGNHWRSYRDAKGVEHIHTWVSPSTGLAGKPAVAMGLPPHSPVFMRVGERASLKR